MRAQQDHRKSLSRVVARPARIRGNEPYETSEAAYASSSRKGADRLLSAADRSL